MNLSFLLGYALTSIFALEQSMPLGGMGSTKKEIVMNGVQTLLKATIAETSTLAGAGSNVGTNREIGAMTEAVSGFIDSTVHSLNRSQVFAGGAALATAG